MTTQPAASHQAILSRPAHDKFLTPQQLWQSGAHQQPLTESPHSLVCLALDLLDLLLVMIGILPRDSRR